MPNQHHHTFGWPGLWMQPSKLLVMRILAHDWKPLTDIAGALCRQLTQAHNECRLEAHMPRKILGGGVCVGIFGMRNQEPVQVPIKFGTSIIFPDEFRSPFVALIKLLFVICQIRAEKG